jgi:hypothetical protein
MSKLPDESFTDVSGRVKQTASNKHQHPVNLGVHPGMSKKSDFETKGVEVPARAQRERVNPAEAAKQRRAGLIEVTPVVSPSGHSHIFEPPPSKL